MAQYPAVIDQLAPYYGWSVIEDVEHIVQGHINATYRVIADGEHYILQRINTTIFTRPAELMNNIELVTSHLRSRGYETLEIVRTIDGELMAEHDGGTYRVYREVLGVVSYNVGDSPELMRKAGAAFGEFQNALADFDATQLVDTIANFHHTPLRYEAFTAAVEADAVGRAETVREEIAFFVERAGQYAVVTDAIADGSVPVRVTHNDTKINNILMDATTGDARAIIDLDTVMPGSLLYDFGDALRSGGSTAEEDEKDLSKVHFDLDLFSAYADGFLSQVGEAMTSRERELLAFSVRLMTLECGLRFLMDYLQGDVYFGVSRPEHNLDRARTQIALVRDLEQLEDQMNAIVERIGS